MFQSFNSRRIVVQQILIGLAILTQVGCGSSKGTTESPPLVELERAPAPLRLHRAIEAEFNHRKIPIRLNSAKKGVIVSEEFTVNPEVRKRYIGRVLAMPNGLAFKIHVEYERRDRRDTEELWIDARETFSDKAIREEQEIGQAVQARFEP